LITTAWLALVGGAHATETTWTVAIEIAAPPEVVWAVLVDLGAYAAWNPWLPHAAGEARTGAEVDVEVVLGDERRAAKHVVLEVEPPSLFCWRDAGWTAWLVSGRRCRRLAVTDQGGTQLTQVLTLGGPLRAAAVSRYGEALASGLRAESDAVRARAECQIAPAGCDDAL